MLSSHSGPTSCSTNCSDSKMSMVENTLAKTVLGLRKHDSATLALTTLHWLPVRQRVTFKIATVTFKALQTSQPQYLKDLLIDYVPPRQLRSSSQQLLTESRTRTVMGERAYQHSATTVWNNLPATIRNCHTLACFRNQLKIPFFSCLFSLNCRRPRLRIVLTTYRRVTNFIDY